MASTRASFMPHARDNCRCSCCNHASCSCPRALPLLMTPCSTHMQTASARTNYLLVPNAPAHAFAHAANCNCLCRNRHSFPLRLPPLPSLVATATATAH
eukprot:7818612-Pyramimonas_sp.AAC.1